MACDCRILDCRICRGGGRWRHSGEWRKGTSSINSVIKVLLHYMLQHSTYYIWKRFLTTIHVVVSQSSFTLQAHFAFSFFFAASNKIWFPLLTPICWDCILKMIVSWESHNGQ
jgi:hypothetical protein